MKYNPDNPLSNSELDKLSEEDLFEYLDSKAKYLKKFTTPLDSYHTKRYATMSKGKALNDDEMKVVKEIGKIGDDAVMDNVKEIIEKKGGHPNLRDKGIKNIKTNRRQWFD